MSDTATEAGVRREADETGSRPDRAGERILTLPTLAWLARLYDQQLRRRMASVTAMAHSEILTNAVEEAGREIHRAVGRIKAIEAWAGVISEVSVRLQAWLLLALGPVVAVLAPLWDLSGVSGSRLATILTFALAAWTVSALVTVPLMAVPKVGWALAQATLLSVGAMAMWAGGVSLWHSSILAAAVVTVPVAVMGRQYKLDSEPSSDYPEGQWRGDVRGLLAVIVILVVPFLAVRVWFPPHHAIGALLGGAMVSVAAFTLVGFLLAYCLDLYEYGERHRIALAAGIAIVGGSVAAFVLLPEHPQWVFGSVRSGLWTAWVILALLVALSLLSSALRIALWRRKSALHPMDDVVDTLLAAVLTMEFGKTWDKAALADRGVELTSLVKQSDVKLPALEPGSSTDDSAKRFRDARDALDWRDLDLRRIAVAKLNYVALLLERDLPQRLRSGHHLTDEYLAEQGRQMAAAVRQWARELLLGGPSTLERYRERIRPNLVAAAVGEWQAFERGEPRSAAPRLSLLRRFLLSLRALLIAVLPGAVVVGLFLGREELPGGGEALLGPAMTVSVAWFLANVLRWADPHRGGSMETAAELADVSGVKLPDLSGLRPRIPHL